MSRPLRNLARLIYRVYCEQHGIPYFRDTTPEYGASGLAYPPYTPDQSPLTKEHDASHDATRGRHARTPPGATTQDEIQAELERLRAENAALKATKRKQRKQRGRGGKRGVALSSPSRAKGYCLR